MYEVLVMYMWEWALTVVPALLASSKDDPYYFRPKLC